MSLFLVKKWLSLLVYPLVQSLLFLVIATILFLLSSRRFAIGALVVGLSWLWLSSTGAFADWLMEGLEEDFYAQQLNTLPKADAIVLLGGATSGLTRGGDMGDLNEAADRLLTALKLFKLSKAPLIIATGGALDDGKSEACIMRDMLELMGVPANSILLEEAALDTWQNATFTAEILDKMNTKKILLVTSAYHMPRALWVFNRILSPNIEIVPASSDYQISVDNVTLSRWVPNARDLFRSSIAIKEIIGFWIYRISDIFD